ncbi:MAG: 30S ribosomal protein S8 [Candidatus Babeliaceae bacterium]
MSIDTIANFLTIIRNGVLISAASVQVPFSKIKHQIALLLKEEGFLYDAVVQGEGKDKKIIIYLKYKNGESVIHEIKRISLSGRRVYEGFTQIKPVIGGLGLTILTTNRGLMTHKKARQLGVGGEIICTIW